MPCSLAICRALRAASNCPQMREGRAPKEGRGRKVATRDGRPTYLGECTEAGRRGVKRDKGFMPRTRGMRNREAYICTYIDVRRKGNECKEGKGRGSATDVLAEGDRMRSRMGDEGR